MKSLCSSLLSPLLLCVISAGVAACSGNPKDNAMTACAASFSKSETAEDDDGDSVKVFAEGEESKLAACKQGVTWGDQNLYQANAKTVPPLNTFRSSYQSTKAYCNAFPSDGERMACLDGLDGYTGLLADSANYQWRDNHNDDRSLTDDYFVNRSYYEVYDDRSWDDDLWLYYLMHRLSYPEYYPGYRRDQYYFPYTRYPGTPYSSRYRFANEPHVFANPQRPVGAGFPSQAASVGFGPKSPPRPYYSGPWYAGDRPGMPGAPAPQRFSSSTPGATKPVWGQAGQSKVSTNVSSLASRSSSTGFSAPASRSVIRGGFGSTASGGGSSGS